MTSKCCKGKPKYEVTYDCGDKEQTLIFCERHYNSDPIFQKHITKIEELT